MEAICSGIFVHVQMQPVSFNKRHYEKDFDSNPNRVSCVLLCSRLVAGVREQISFHSDVGEGKRLAGRSSEEKFDTVLCVIDPLLTGKQFHLRS